MNGGSDAVAARNDPDVPAHASAAGAAHEDQAAARAHPAVGAAGDLQVQPRVIAESVAHLRRVHLQQRAVARPTRGDHHVVYRFRQSIEEVPQRRTVCGVERGGAVGAHLGRCFVEPIRIAAGEDDLCTL